MRNLICGLLAVCLAGAAFGLTGTVNFAAKAATPPNITPQNPAVIEEERLAKRRRATQMQRARELDLLFKQLMSTSDENEGRNLVNHIWMTWHRSGDRKIDDLISVATIYMDEGEFAAALPKLDQVIKRAPDYPEGWNRRATLLFHMGQFDRSLADIMQTLKLEPRHFGALAGRGLIYSARGQFAKALQAFEQALKYNPFLKERFNLIPILRKKIGQQKI